MVGSLIHKTWKMLMPEWDPISRLLSALQLLSKLTNSMMDEIDRWWWHWWRGQQWWRGWWRGWCCAGSCATSRWGLPWFQLFSRDGPLQGECLPSSFFPVSFCHFCQVALARCPCHLPLATCINSHVTLSKPPFVWPLPNEISYEILFIFELRTETCLASSPKECLKTTRKWKSKWIILQIVTQFENKYLPSFVCLIIPAHIFYSAFTSNFVVLDTLLWGWEVSLYHKDLGRFWLIIIFAGCKTSIIVTGTRGVDEGSDEVQGFG